MAGYDSLWRDTLWPLCEAEEMNPGLCWKQQDTGNITAIGYLPKKGCIQQFDPMISFDQDQERNTCYRKQNYKKESPKPFKTAASDSWLNTRGFGVCPNEY